MKKLLSAIILFLTISCISVTAHAAQDEFKSDTATHINLLNKDRFAVNLVSNKLVFENEPISREYEEIWLEVRSFETRNEGKSVLKTTYVRGRGDGAMLDINGLPDGTYSLYIGYVFYGELSEDYEGDDLDYLEEDEEELAEDFHGIQAIPSYQRYFEIIIKNGQASFSLAEHFPNNAEIAAKERTDEYARDYYRNELNIDYFKKTDIYQQAHSIVKGITDDYEKVRAIQSWVYENIDYDWDAFEGRAPLRYLSAADVLKGKITVCDGYANLTVALIQAVGIPAKKITGIGNGINGWGAHAWTEAYVDNRWVFMDSTWGDKWFDMPLYEYSIDHKRYDQGPFSPDHDIEDGSLYFYDIANDVTLKEVKNLPFNTVINSTYGFDIKDLFFDAESKKPFQLGKMKLTSSERTIFVDYGRGKGRYSVEFVIKDPNGYAYDGNAYEYYGYEGYSHESTTPFYPYFGLTRNVSATGWQYFAAHKSKLKKPVDPVIKGYEFIGWYNADTGKKWDFSKDKVKGSTRLETRWKKIKSDKAFKVTLQSQNGTTAKTLTVKYNSKISKPATPTRKGYKFAGWYKDYDCKYAWSFTKDKVLANTTLYAKWEKK